MDNHNDGHEPGMGPDIDLLCSDLQIVQDVEEDLEQYTRLVRLGRFGEASKLFRETLHRHLGCFAVLAEHCNALLYQGNYAQAYLVLKDAIARQEASATGSVRFETSEVHFLRVFLTYVKMFAEKDKYIGRREAKSALSQARWYRNSITATDPRELMDVEVCFGNKFCLPPCARFCHAHPTLMAANRRSWSYQNAQFFQNRSEVHRASITSRRSVDIFYRQTKCASLQLSA